MAAARPSIVAQYFEGEDLFNQELFTADEVEFFHEVPDMVHSQISRIVRAITTRQAAGGIKAPPPIVSRVFQELSNGVLAYNNACKLKEVPVPFALVHFNALLLMFFVLTSPLVVSCFTGHPIMSIVTSCLITSGFASLWLVANELEDPFGYDANDIEMKQYHEEFKSALKSSLVRPWLLRDMWWVKSGEWQPHPSHRPKPTALVGRPDPATSSATHSALSSDPPTSSSLTREQQMSC